MAKKKDCFGSETYVCRTQDCPYMAECVQVVWDKKLKRVLTRGGTVGGPTPASGGDLRLKAAPRVRVRSKEFLAQ